MMILDSGLLFWGHPAYYTVAKMHIFSSKVEVEKLTPCGPDASRRRKLKANHSLFGVFLASLSSDSKTNTQ